MNSVPFKTAEQVISATTSSVLVNRYHCRENYDHSKKVEHNHDSSLQKQDIKAKCNNIIISIIHHNEEKLNSSFTW